MRRQIIAEQLESVLRNSLQAPALRLVSLDGERPSVDVKREPWIEIKYGPASPDDWFGIVPATAQFEWSAGKDREVLQLIVKVNPRLGLARNLIPWIIENKSIRLDRPYWEYRNADEPLWRGLLDDAHARFPGVVTEQVKRRRHRLIDTMDGWHRAKDALPGTLAHNDFNNRNVGFRPGVVVLDWELAECNTAHRDLVEMLTFVVPSAATRADINWLVERHRTMLAEMGVKTGLDRDTWTEAFRCELKVEAINRVSMQCIFEAAFPLAYFERINANIERLLDLYG